MDMEEYKAPVDYLTLKRRVQTFVDATRTNVKLCQRDRDYFDGNQISGHMLVELERRGQPPVYTNKIGSAIRGLLGIMDAGVSDPEAKPRNFKSQDAADVVTKLLRYIADRADYQRFRRLTSDNFMKDGTCAGMVEVNQKGEVEVSQVRFDEFIFDPFSQELDFRDARYLGVAKLEEEDNVSAKWPLYKANPVSLSSAEALFEDDSKKTWWSDPLRRRVRIIDLYYQSADGEWHRSVFTESGSLFEGKSEYHDDYGQTICPIEGESFEIKRDGSRYGPIRDMVPLQDSINARKSRLLHLANHRQTQETDQFAPPENRAIAKEQASKADGTIPYGWAPIQSPDMAQGQMNVLANDEAALDRMAPTPAVLGRITANGESGRARQILQQAGYTELARSFGQFESFEHRMYRLMWFAAREYFSSQKEIAITTDPRTPQFMTLNDPVMGPTMVPAVNPVNGQPMINPQTGQPMMVQGTGQVGVHNHVAHLDMDIILTTVEDTVTLEQETFQQITDYLSANKLSPFSPEARAFIELSPFPNKRETLERLQSLEDEMDQKNAAAQQAQQQQAQALAHAELQGKQAKAAKDAATAQKIGAETGKIGAQTNQTVADTEKTAQEVHLIEASVWNGSYGKAQQDADVGR